MASLIESLLAAAEGAQPLAAMVRVLGAAWGAARVVPLDRALLAPVSSGSDEFLGQSPAAMETLSVPIRRGTEKLGALEILVPAPPPSGLRSMAEQAAALVGLQLAIDLANARAAHVEAIFDSIAHPIFVKDRSFRWVQVNQAFCDLVARSREELIGRSDYDYFSKEEADFFRAKDVEMFARRTTVEIEEEPITDAKGRLHLLATTKVPLFGPDGEVTHLVGIIHDITRLKTVEAELQRKNEELARENAERTAAVARLDALNRELEAFSYSVSHDLRAPLRSIGRFSEILLEESSGRLDERGRDQLGRVLANAQRMRRLIDDILALSRVSSAELRMGPVDLGALAREAVERLREGEPDRRVEVRIAPGLLVRGDARLLAVALENLLGNAWKFTSRVVDARIEVGAVQCGEETRYFVRDNGAGFDMAFADKLFRPFSRLHPAEEFPGTGVGLATVQRIVHRHGGRIWAEAAPGMGATFFFTLS